MACYAILLLNIWLAFRFVEMLTESTEIAALAAFVFSYHNHFMDLYQNGGTIYELLCFAFYIAALTGYIAVRRTGSSLSFLQTLVLAALSIAALNSKEMAVTLPLALWAYELVWWPPPSIEIGRAHV